MFNQSKVICANASVAEKREMARFLPHGQLSYSVVFKIYHLVIMLI